MAENKTRATGASVARYLAAIPDEERRRDCAVLIRLMSSATGAPPVMWGAGIVGFGSHHYRYESGREGEICAVGFSSRRPAISLYLGSGFPRREALLARLGKHKEAKACLYLRRLGDVDAGVLQALIAAAVAARKRGAVVERGEAGRPGGPATAPPGRRRGGSRRSSAG